VFLEGITVDFWKLCLPGLVVIVFIFWNSYLLAANAQSGDYVDDVYISIMSSNRGNLRIQQPQLDEADEDCNFYLVFIDSAIGSGFRQAKFNVATRMGVLEVVTEIEKRIEKLNFDNELQCAEFVLDITERRIAEFLYSIVGPLGTKRMLTIEARRSLTGDTIANFIDKRKDGHVESYSVTSEEYAALKDCYLAKMGLL
jgi:hypothetical protein